MKDPATEPLRGEAAWRASLKAIAKRNEAACAAAARERAAREETAAQQALALAKREAKGLPRQPGR
jgi:hypothetical protein